MVSLEDKHNSEKKKWDTKTNQYRDCDSDCDYIKYTAKQNSRVTNMCASVLQF